MTCLSVHSFQVGEAPVWPCLPLGSIVIIRGPGFFGGLLYPDPLLNHSNGYVLKQRASWGGPSLASKSVPVEVQGGSAEHRVRGRTTQNVKKGKG